MHHNKHIEKQILRSIIVDYKTLKRYNNSTNQKPIENLAMIDMILTAVDFVKSTEFMALIAIVGVCGTIGMARV